MPRNPMKPRYWDLEHIVAAALMTVVGIPWIVILYCAAVWAVREIMK